jgi:hypothetical protein
MRSVIKSESAISMRFCRQKWLEKPMDQALLTKLFAFVSNALTLWHIRKSLVLAAGLP